MRFSIAVAVLMAVAAQGFTSLEPRAVRTTSVLFNSYLDQLSAYSAYQHKEEPVNEETNDNFYQEPEVPYAAPAQVAAVIEDHATTISPPVQAQAAAEISPQYAAPVQAATVIEDPATTISPPVQAQPEAEISPPDVVVPSTPMFTAPPVQKGLPPVEPSDPETIPINGWVPNEELPLYGLPGAIAPVGFFDPMGFATDATLNTAKLMREAEVLHGRVAMLAVLGYATGENFEGPFHLTGPAIRQMDQLPSGPSDVLALAVTAVEIYRAIHGWKFPNPAKASTNLFALKETYYPGDIGFDPLNFKPNDPWEFDEIAAKELSNGRLAMIAIALITLIELATGRPVFA